MKKAKKEKVALFRYGVIAPLVNLRETQRGQMEAIIKEITSKQWEIPFSKRSYIGRSTVLEWLSRYRQSGHIIDSLFPKDREDKGKARCMCEETEMALVNLKKTNPSASLPVLIKLAKQKKVLPVDFRASNQSIYRIFEKHGISKGERAQEDIRRFEAELPNDLWQSDCMHGPMVIEDGRQRKTFLFAFIDDQSRIIPHGEFYLREHLKTFIDCLKKALAKRGLPVKLYVDNGPYFRSHLLQYATASLGITLIYCRAHRPEGKGKIERFFKTLRMQFLPLLPDTLTLDELNERFHSWIDKEYHIRVHSSTKEKPIDRYLKDLHLIRSAPKNLNDYFRIRVQRKVDRDRTVSLNGKLYEAPVELVERTVTLLYHDDDPKRIELFYRDKSYGFLVPLDMKINCQVKRFNNITQIVQREQDNNNCPNIYSGGKLFERRIKDNDV